MRSLHFCCLHFCQTKLNKLCPVRWNVSETFMYECYTMERPVCPRRYQGGLYNSIQRICLVPLTQVIPNAEWTNDIFADQGQRESWVSGSLQQGHRRHRLGAPRCRLHPLHGHPWGQTALKIIRFICANIVKGKTVSSRHPCYIPAIVFVFFVQTLGGFELSNEYIYPLCTV